jgi:hypothetical protein
MSTQQHPDAEELARYQAGEIGGPRGRQLAAHIADCARCASVSDDLAAVSRVLASVPAPSMPDAVESRITAALAAEAANRQAASPAAAAAANAAGAAGSPADGPADGPAASEQRSRRLRLVHSGKSKSHARGFRPVMVVLSAAACLVLVGFGYLLSRTGSSSSSAPASAAAPAALPASGSARGPVAAGSAAAGSGAQPSGVAPSASAQRPLQGQQVMPFLVARSSTNYTQAALGTQVRGELNRRSKPAGTGRQSSGSSGGLPPSPSLIGCVERVTGNVPPKLVDRATYEGKAAYVIAVSDYAWVVGPGCTASNTDLIASVALPR